MATVEVTKEDLEEIKETLKGLATKVDLDALDAKVDANHNAVMASLESISRSVGRSPNY